MDPGGSFGNKQDISLSKILGPISKNKKCMLPDVFV